MNGTAVGIFISPKAGAPMQEVFEVMAIQGQGLEGDRYAKGAGSFSKGIVGKRQVTLINGLFFEKSGFRYADSRRNIITLGIELMWLIGREFQIGEAFFRGVKYCDPCERPSRLSNKRRNFKDAFFDRGGLVTEVIKSGLIKINDLIIPPPKGY